MGVSSILKLPSLAGRLPSITSGVAGVGSKLSGSLRGLWSSMVGSVSGKGIMGGLVSFFGLEWLTSGGLVDSASDTLGVSETTGSIILIVVLALIIYLAFRYLDSRIPSRSRSSGGGGEGKQGKKGGKKRKGGSR